MSMDTPRRSPGTAKLVATAAAGAAVAAACFMAAGGVESPAAGQEPSAGANFTLSVAQLRINQRISSAAVRRSNESLQLLDPIRPLTNQPDKVLGWGTTNLRDGAVTGSKIGDGSVTEGKLDAGLAARLPLWALINTDGTIIRTRGAVAATRINAGNYRVDFGRNLTECGFTGTQHNVTANQIGFIGIQVEGVNQNRLFVRTTNNAGVTQDRQFMVQVAC